MRVRALTLFMLAALPLGGCAAGIAASAIGAAARSADDAPGPGANLSPAALAACRARAAEQGEVTIIDVERRNSGRVIVWGTVQNPSGRSALECRFDGEITKFRLRPLAAR